MAPVLSVDSVETRFGENWVHRGISFDVEPGTIVALIGGSGCGKSTLLKELIGLLRPTAGRLSVFGTDIWNSSIEELQRVRNRFGVLFQNGALFSSLSVGENIAAPLAEHLHLSPEYLKEIVQLRLALTGLSPETTLLMPSELSGGMRKRVALARALALEPELLFLDEPTSGLDPINARAFDRLVRTLSQSLGLTVFMVTHDLDSILSVTDRVIVLEGGVVLADGPVSQVRQVAHPWIQSYFSSQAQQPAA